MCSSRKSADGLAGQEEQGRAEPFAGEADAVADDFVGLGVVAVELVGQPGVDAVQLAADRRVERGEGLLQVGGRLADGAHGNPFEGLAKRRNGDMTGPPAIVIGLQFVYVRCRGASVRCGRPIFLPVECVRS